MNKIFTFLLLSTFAFNVYADEKLDKVLEEIQALNKDLKTLEKAVYSKSFATQSAGSSEGVPASLEGALTRQLVKLSELEEQIQRITAGHEETLFNLQKVSERLEKMQKDTELRFSELGVKSTVQSNSNNQQNSSAIHDFTKILHFACSGKLFWCGLYLTCISTTVLLII